MNDVDSYDTSIAVIGMVGRFPGAGSIAAFWRNLRNGVESISFLSDHELAEAGVTPQVLNHPNYVKASPVLDGIEMFDAAFFDYTPREAETMDPQQRLFLECAWEALENAGCDPERYEGRIGVFGGTSASTFFLFNFASNPGLAQLVDTTLVAMGNDIDHLTTRVSYKLNLRGPSVTVQTACSTSLVAVGLACQSLLHYQCDMALAGGVSITVPQKGGYFYREGGIASPDGHCRAFDAQAQGTIFGSGVGIVVLKRLKEALADGDAIQAIIRGCAVNNDGALKVGYTAPSVAGQAAVIADALAMAMVEPETIGYIETHGTGTALGDPIEIAALTQVFRAHTGKKGFCAIGSVKTNVGHLNAAAGVAGLIKTILMLQHREIPPSLHFEQPNPRIDFASSPFHVNTTLSKWVTNGKPRRAGVSSFGIGGTNAHAVLEEAPSARPSGKSREWQLLVLSAKTAPALDAMIENLKEHLERQPDANLADVAYTLQVGRRVFSYRRMLVCRSRQDAIQAFEARDAERVFSRVQALQDRPVTFMFPGQGAQYPNMALGLYQSEATFRAHIDRCAEILQPHLGFDLRSVLYPGAECVKEADGRLGQTLVAQPALFTIEYALARLWMAWGVRPRAMIGHSIGEYVAACLAGVFSLEEALALVAARGRLMQQMPAGEMMAVPLPEQEVLPLLGTKLCLAAVNAPSLCVVAGPLDAVAGLEDRLAKTGVNGRRLHTSHAYHSAMMDPILVPFAEQVGQVSLKPPKIPYISNLTGTWITAAETMDVGYWVRHLRQTVRFAQGMHQLLQEPERILLEVGPGQTLTTLTRQQMDAAYAGVALNSLRHPQDQCADLAFVLGVLGKLWLAGAQVDWFGFYTDEQRQRVQLPTYPFERQRYWLELQSTQTAATPRQASLEEGSAAEVEQPALALHPRPSLLNVFAPPSTKLEQVLADIWQEVLGIEQVGIHDNFFELGGHSLTATQLVARLQGTFAIDWPVRDLFEAPTIAQLARAIEEKLYEKVKEMSEEDAQRLL